MIQINERRSRDEGGALVLLKNSCQERVCVFVCVRKLHFCVEERGEVQRKCSWIVCESKNL